MIQIDTELLKYEVASYLRYSLFAGGELLFLEFAQFDIPYIFIQNQEIPLFLTYYKLQSDIILYAPFDKYINWSNFIFNHISINKQVLFITLFIYLLFKLFINSDQQFHFRLRKLAFLLESAREMKSFYNSF